MIHSDNIIARNEEWKVEAIPY